MDHVLSYGAPGFGSSHIVCGRLLKVEEIGPSLTKQADMVLRHLTAKVSPPCGLNTAAI